MLTYIKIDGFKSFQDFEMEFTPLTVVAGPNGSGKSNLFDALQLLSDLAKMPLKEAFRKQSRGDLVELFTQYEEGWFASRMKFTVDLLVDKTVQTTGSSPKVLINRRLRYQLEIERFTGAHDIEDVKVVFEELSSIDPIDDKWSRSVLKDNIREWLCPSNFSAPDKYIATTPNGIIRGAKLSLPDNEKAQLKIENPFVSVLGLINSAYDPHIHATAVEMRKWNFFQLNPENLRKPTQKSSGDDKISPTGLDLPGTLFRIGQEDPYMLTVVSGRISNFLPRFKDVYVHDAKEAGLFIIKFKGTDNKTYPASLLSEGTLRLLTLCIMEVDEEQSGLMCLEEPENGIHPGRLNSLSELLKNLGDDLSDPEISLRQVIVNTHSPLLISEMVRWKDDPTVSVHFAHIRSTVMDKQVTSDPDSESKRVLIHASIILPVDMKSDKKLKEMDIDQKLSVHLVKEYLSTGDLSDALTVFNRS